MITLLFTWGGTTSLVWYSGGQSSSPPAHSLQSDVPPDAAVPLPDSPPATCPPVPNVSTVPNPARRASEIAQQPVETSPASVESAPEGNGTSGDGGTPP